MELTNEQRRCMGLEEVPSSWERVEMDEEHIVFFDGDIIRKIIHVKEDAYHEYGLSAKTAQNRTVLCPKTSRGKEKKLTVLNLSKISGEGCYFHYSRGHVQIANYSTQITYYSSRMAGLSPMSVDELEKFLDRWVEETDDIKLAEVRAFSTAKRKHCKFKEGDFFRYKIDRTHFGYGRILLDVTRLRKQGIKHWDILMGKPLIIQVYHILAENLNVPPEELKQLKACPSQYIMDNIFYYGECEIIGNAPIQEETACPIMYGRSISGIEPDKIMFQCGDLYKEIPLEGNTVVPGSFLNNGIGWSINIDKNVLEACIQEDSNEPFWRNRDLYFLRGDLRNPKHKEALQQVLAQFGLSWKDIGESQ